MRRKLVVEALLGLFTVCGGCDCGDPAGDDGPVAGVPFPTPGPGGNPPQQPLPPLPPLPASTWQQGLERTAVSLYAGGSFCSGTWLSPHAVLTAAHCVEQQAPGSFSIVPGPDANTSTTRLPTGGLYIHPSYLAARAQGGSSQNLATEVAADFAVVIVPGGMPAGAQAAILDFETTVKAGASYHGAGFGHTGRQGDAAPGIGVLRQKSLTALYKFDNHRRPAGGGVGHYWILDGGTQSQVCQGDSGGPAFWVSENTVMQFGVNSYITAATRDELAEIQRLDDKLAGGGLWSMDELDTYDRFNAALHDVQDRGCSRLVAVASVGEARDWIAGRRDEIEAMHGG